VLPEGVQQGADAEICRYLQVFSGVGVIDRVWNLTYATKKKSLFSRKISNGNQTKMLKNVEGFFEEKFLIMDDTLISLKSENIVRGWESEGKMDFFLLVGGMVEDNSEERGIFMENINSHFIFNALNNIKCAVMLQEQNAPDLIDYFSKYLRYVFCYGRREELVPAGKVLDFMLCYGNLQEARFEKLQFEYCIGSTDFFLPPFYIEEILSLLIKEFVMDKTCDGYLIVETEEEADQNVLTFQTLSGVYSEEKWKNLMGSNGKLSDILKKGEQYGFAVSAERPGQGGVRIRIIIPHQE